MKITHYEFWPTLLFYFPGLVYYLIMCLKYQYLGLIAVANPGMIKVGIFQAPKVDVLNQLGQQNPEYIAKCLSLPPGQEDKWEQMARDFIKQHKLNYPVIVKPQVGQRGVDIKIVNNQHKLPQALKTIPANMLYMLQEFITGIEYGIHYVRFPKENCGRIFSLGRKDFIYLHGDGKSNLEKLIMKHPRACIMYKIHCAKHQDKLQWVPKQGEKFKLVTIGTHSKGAIFVDINHHITDSLTAKIDSISKGYEGFHIGRYDLLASSENDLQQGKNFKIIELNSVMGEPPHMYHPSNSIWRGYAILFQYIGIVVEIAKQNIALGTRPMPWHEFINYTRNSYRDLT